MFTCGIWRLRHRADTDDTLLYEVSNDSVKGNMHPRGSTDLHRHGYQMRSAFLPSQACSEVNKTLGIRASKFRSWIDAFLKDGTKLPTRCRAALAARFANGCLVQAARRQVEVAGKADGRGRHSLFGGGWEGTARGGRGRRSV